MACFTAWDIQGCGCAGGLSCSPCDLPAPNNLSISLKQTPPGTTIGPFTMTYTVGPPVRWTIDCTTGNGFFSAALSCGLSNVISFHPQYYFFGCGGSPDDFTGLTLIDYTCSPLHLHYQATAFDFPGDTFDFYIDYP